MFTKIDKKSLSDEILYQMISKILNGIFIPGNKLPPERDMAAQMNVNRNTLREALRKLEVLGLLSVRQGDGIYVHDYRNSGNLELMKYILDVQKEKTSEIICDILKIRTLVIPDMASTAAKRMTEDDIETITGIYKNENTGIIEKDLLIHSFIARVSGNLFFMLLLNFFNDIFRQYAHLYFSFEENRSISARFHRNIVEALCQKDTKKARNVMLDVLVYTEQRVYDYMENFNEKI